MPLHKCRLLIQRTFRPSCHHRGSVLVRLPLCVACWLLNVEPGLSPLGVPSPDARSELVLVGDPSSQVGFRSDTQRELRRAAKMAPMTSPSEPERYLSSQNVNTGTDPVASHDLAKAAQNPISDVIS